MKRAAIIFFFALITNAFFAQVNLSSSLTACYVLDGSATEPINNLTGVLSGPTPTVNRFNTPNSALYFNGNTQFVTLPNSPLLKPADAISFSCWIYGTVQTNCYILFTQNNLSAFFEAYELCVEPNMTFMTRKSGPAGINQANSITQFQINTWYHLALTIDNSFVKLYVNGVLEATTPSTFNGFDYMVGNDVYLGASNSFFDGPFSGIIDNARFYNRTLNAAEVLALYNTDPSCVAAPGPVASFSVTGAACAGDTIQLVDLSTNSPTQWQWTVPDGTTANASAQNPIYVFSNPGVYSATLQASNAVGTSTTSSTFTILPMPPVQALVTPTLICGNSTATLSATGANTYTWSPTNVTGSTYTFLAQNNQTFVVTGTAQNGCKNSATIAVTILPKPLLQALVTPTVVCRNSTATLSATGANTYTWSPTNVIGSTYTFVALNSQTLVVTGTAQNGCKNSATITVGVKTCETIGIEELSLQADFRVFYDQQLGVLRINRSDEQAATVKLYSNDLRLIYENKNVQGMSYDIVTREFEAGMYFLVIGNEHYKVTKKVILQ